jgi:hypothetical protein
MRPEKCHTNPLAAHRSIGLRAGQPMMLTAAHDGRLIADVVAEWSRRHGKPCRLTLTGLAGGSWQSGPSGEHLELDALDFCWTVSGRQPGTGLLATPVLF